jgi:hypothetical protein
MEVFMKRSLSAAVVAVAVLAAPGVAHAQWSIRGGIETPLYFHASSNGQSISYNIGDTFQPTLDILAGFYLLPVLSLDVEFRRGLGATGTNSSTGMAYTRQLTYLGPGVTFDVPGFALYGRASLPIQLENTAVLYLRVGGGLKLLDIGVFRLYLEVTADFPWAGSGVSFFGSQAINAGAGVWFKF